MSLSDCLRRIEQLGEYLKRDKRYDQVVAEHLSYIQGFLEAQKPSEVPHELGKPSLSPLEAQLLSYFSKNIGKICTDEELMKGVWKKKVTPRAVNAVVERLRYKVEDDKSNPQYIITVRGRGYMLRTPIKKVE